MTSCESWTGLGERVWVGRLTPQDLPALRAGIESSLESITTWGPSGLDGLDTLPHEQSLAKQTFLVHARERIGPHDLVGRINLNHTVPGRMLSTTLGYDAYAPYTGRGMMREGLALLLDHCFAAPPEGQGLHRVEAGVQPANVRSAGLLRSLGFQRTGHDPALVRLPTLGDPDDDWRSHDRYALLAPDWPGSRARSTFAEARPPRVVAVVDDEVLARGLAVELGLPLFDADRHAAWELLRDSPIGAVVRVGAALHSDVDALLRAAGARPDRTLIALQVSGPHTPSEVVRWALRARAVALGVRPD